MEEVSSRKILAALLAYFAAVIVLGALLAPWLAWLGEAVATRWDWLPWEAGTKFRRYFDRSVMLVALAALWPLTRIVGLRSWADVGLAWSAGFAKHLALGVALAIGSVLIVGGLGIVEEEESGWWLGSWSWEKRLVTASLVAVVEEVFFRGILLTALLRGGSAWLALLASSVFYSAIHFLKPARVVNALEVDAWSGFVLLANCFERFTEPAALAAPLLNLTIVGVILGCAFWRTRSLALSMGLHAGWVFATAGKFELPWGAAPVLLATLVVVIWFTRPKPPGISSSPP